MAETKRKLSTGDMSSRKDPPGASSFKRTRSCSSAASDQPEIAYAVLRSPLRLPLSIPLIELLGGVYGNTGGNKDEIGILSALYNGDDGALADSLEKLRKVRKSGATAFQEAMEKWDGKDENPFTDTFLIEELTAACKEHDNCT